MPFDVEPEKRGAASAPRQQDTPDALVDVGGEAARTQSEELSGAAAPQSAGGGGSPVSGGDGTRQMFTVAVPRKPGSTELIYLGKWYFENVTEAQKAKYEAHQISGGWFPITKTQYEIQNGATNDKGDVTRKPHPEAWTYSVRGPGGKVVTKNALKIDGEDLTVDHKTYHEADQRECDVIVRFSQPVNVSCNATIFGMVAGGTTERVLATIPFSVGATEGPGHFVLAPGEMVRIEIDVPVDGYPELLGVEVTTGRNDAPKAPDTMPLYGTETPTQADIDAILKAQSK